MLKTKIIIDLIQWIEQNIEKPLSIDTIAKKSGYTKWHLQRMFKQTTGCVIASYIRQRRLTYAALSLRMTSKSIADIVTQYQFDSQQTFTRAFKQQFGITPGHFRREKNIKPIGLIPEINLLKSEINIPAPTYINLPSQTFWGVTYQNNRLLSEVFKDKYILREKFFSNHFAIFRQQSSLVPKKVYAFSDFKSNSTHPDEQHIFYTIALDEPFAMDNVQKFTSDAGLYLCFNFQGRPDDFDRFILQIYLSVLPSLPLRRREGIDIEVFYPKDFVLIANEPNKKPLSIHGDYYIPIIQDITLF